MSSFWLRALCSIVADTSLAMLCGLCMARVWLRHSTDLVTLPTPVAPAITLVCATAMQLVALTASFSGESSFRALLAALPDVIGTHPGTVLFLTLLAAICLAGIAGVSRGGARFRPASAVALAVCLCLRAGTGHSATEHIFSVPQLLQLLHLSGMAVWSGGVLVAGLFLLPRMQSLPQPHPVFRNTLASLSLTSTWSVGVTLLAGLCKSWMTTKDNFPSAWHSPWTMVLLAKIALTCTALLLGVANRTWVNHLNDWTDEARARSTRVLRVEAAAMLLILMLSGVLANMSPPGE